MSGLGELSNGKLGLVLLKPLLVSAPSWEACQQGPLSGNLSFQRTEMQTSQAQLEPSSWGSNYLGLQLDQFHCGDGKATLGLSFTTWSFAANSVSGNRGSLFQGKEEKKNRKL